MSLLITSWERIESGAGCDAVVIESRLTGQERGFVTGCSTMGTNLKWVFLAWCNGESVELTYKAEPRATSQTCGGQIDAEYNGSEGAGGSTRTLEPWG